MTKHQLVDAFSVKANISVIQAQKYLDTLVEIIESTVESGDKVGITGFGVFEKGKRAARHGVDPQTGEDIQIPEMTLPKFRAGKRFKDRVR